MLEALTSSPLLVAELLVLGAGTGFLAGLLGIGGGMTLVPFMTFILTSKGFPADMVVKVAVATSMSTILFTSASSVRAHYKRGAVQVNLLKPLGLGAVVGTFVGAQLAGGLKGGVLAAVFAVIVSYAALQMLLQSRVPQTGQLPGSGGLLGVGGGIGLISSFVGAGGGFITVPFLLRSGVDMHKAVATSAGMGFPIALGGLVGYVLAGWGVEGLPTGSVGYIYLPALLILVLTSVTLAPLGAKVAHSIDTQKLKRIFALVLLALSAYMLTQAF